jgi:hypothetical protein
MSEQSLFENMSEAELESQLFGPEPAPETPEEKPQSEPETQELEKKEEVPETPEVQPTEESDPEADTEAELRSLEQKERELREKRLQEQLDLMQAHNSRLAGEIGFLKGRLKDRPTRPEREETPEIESEPELDRLRSEIYKINEERSAEKRANAIAEEAAVWRARYTEAKYTPEEVSAAAEKYSKLWQEALDSSDVNSAREIARAVMARVSTEIEERRLENALKAAREKKAESEKRRTETKKSASISATGAIPTPPKKEKTPEDMTPEELARELWGK